MRCVLWLRLGMQCWLVGHSSCSVEGWVPCPEGSAVSSRLLCLPSSTLPMVSVWCEVTPERPIML